MQTRLARADVAQRAQLAGAEDGLDVRVAAGLPHGAHLVVQRAPVLGEHVGPGDHDVDLFGAGGDRGADLTEPLLEGREARGKAGGHRRDRDARTLPGPRPRSPRRRGRRTTAATRIGSCSAPIASSRSARTGRRALAQSRRTRPGVSSLERVVRSIRVTARSSHAACHSFFTVRRVRRVAARRSTALRLTRTSSTQSSSRGIPGFRGVTGTSRGPAREGATTPRFWRLGHRLEHTSSGPIRRRRAHARGRNNRPGTLVY